MKKRAVVLGCGMVGSTIVRDLAADETLKVVAVDVHPATLAKLKQSSGVKTLAADLSSPQKIRGAVAGADVALGALPSALGFAALETLIDAGVNCCDISFMEQDAQELSLAAQNKSVTVVVDCGVAPGLSNMIVGHVDALLDETASVEIYVGGLPRERRRPFEYKAPFAPSDVIEEYTRPSRFRELGVAVTRPALSETELMDFAGVGTLEAFNTDGLRSLLYTISAPNMKEKTLRYPGHVELMRMLRDCGFFDTDEIEVGGVRVRPRDLTSALLFPHWAYQPGEEDVTVMRVIVEGRRDGRRERHTYDLFDTYDSVAGTSSMARTTAFPATIVARRILDGTLNEPGVFAPEQLARRDGFLKSVLAELAGRGVVVTSERGLFEPPAGS